jgi:hypothetical protein
MAVQMPCQRHANWLKFLGMPIYATFGMPLVMAMSRGRTQ